MRHPSPPRFLSPAYQQVLYIASIIRAVIALHDLVLNKLKHKGEEEDREKSKEKEVKEAAEAKAAAAKAKEESKEEKH